MVNSLPAPTTGPPTSPPTVVPEISGRTGHHDYRGMNDVTPYSNLVAKELQNRGYIQIPDETWQLHIAENIPGTDATAVLKAVTIKNRSIVLKVQPGNRDTMYMCHLFPPQRLSGVEEMDKVLHALKGLSQELLEWTKEIEAKTGTNIVGLLTDTDDVEALIRDNYPWQDGPSQEEIATFCGYASDDVRDGFIQTRKLNSALKRLANVSQPSDLWLALARFRFVDQGLVCRYSDGFRLTERINAVLEVVRKENDFAPPQEVDAYLKELTESDTDRRRLESQKARLVRMLEEVSAKEVEATKALEKAKLDRNQVEAQMADIENKLKEPRLVAHNKALERLRKQLSVAAG